MNPYIPTHAAEVFCEHADYATIAFDNVYAIATPSFWHLHPQELLVLQMVLQSVPESSSMAQIPFHLPLTSADRSWYMLMVHLTAGMIRQFDLMHIAHCAPYRQVLQTSSSHTCMPAYSLHQKGSSDVLHYHA